MANAKRKVSGNVAGEFFVDTTCIDCDTCRELAPEIFEDDGEHSYVRAQPASAESRRAALRALVACPTGSIGIDRSISSRSHGQEGRNGEIEEAIAEFPLQIEGPVSYCGFASEDSFGASSYFLEHERGNWLVDSPRWSRHLERAFDARGGLAHVFLTHRDDVADSARWAKRFGARRVIHAADRDAAPDAEVVIDGVEPVELDSDLLAIPVPGHTRGSTALLFRSRFLFAGDHLWWSRNRRALSASRSACWYDWPEQARSMERLRSHRFEWILPGHGDRVRLPAVEMRRELAALVERMRASG